jgi:hypothetical protein
VKFVQASFGITHISPTQSHSSLDSFLYGIPQYAIPTAFHRHSHIAFALFVICTRALKTCVELKFSLNAGSNSHTHGPGEIQDMNDL